jgi:hypothetical protein
MPDSIYALTELGFSHRMDIDTPSGRLLNFLFKRHGKATRSEIRQFSELTPSEQTSTLGALVKMRCVKKL